MLELHEVHFIQIMLLLKPKLTTCYLFSVTKGAPKSQNNVVFRSYLLYDSKNKWLCIAVN